MIQKNKTMRKNAFTIIGLMLLAGFCSSCSKVPAGNVGVKFYLLGKDKGVDYETLKPGRYWIGVNEELFLFPTQRQNKIWSYNEEDNQGFEFQSKEGMKLMANVGIEYQILDENVTTIFEMYKKGCDEITNIVLRNAIRDAFNMASSTRTAEQMYGEGKIEFMNEVKKLATAKAAEKYITLNDVYLLGNIVVPESVTTALNNKIKAMQEAEQRENEIRGAEAQAKKDIAIAEGEAQSLLTKARAEAEANRIIANSLTPTLVEYEKIKKWNGETPKVTGNGGSIINLGK